MQSNFVDSIAEDRCRPTAARNEDSQFRLSVSAVFCSLTMPITWPAYTIKHLFYMLNS